MRERERLGIHHPNQSSSRLIARLLQNPSLEIAAIVMPEPTEGGSGTPSSLDVSDPAIRPLLTRDPARLLRDPALTAVVDCGADREFSRRHPELVERGVALISPFVARLLWGHEDELPDHPEAVLQALLDVVDAAELEVESEILDADLLQLAVRLTGSHGGSMLLLDPESGELGLAAAIGIERELWRKIRIPRDAGVAGRVAALARPLRLRGPALASQFRILRERRDLAAALCIPLVDAGRVLGVLNLNHRSRHDAFDDTTFRYARKLAKSFARIHAAAETRSAQRLRARCDTAARRVGEILGSLAGLDERLGELCRFIAAEVAPGVACVYLAQPGGEGLALVATSLDGSRFGSEYLLRIGQGVDGAAAASRSPRLLQDANGRLAYAALPLLAEDDLVGVLGVQLGAGSSRSPETESILHEIAKVAAQSIRRAERERRVVARIDKLSAINETHLRMIAAADLADVARLGTSAAARILEADHAILRLHDPGSGRFPIRSYFGAANRSQQTRLFRLDQRIASEAVRRRQPFARPDLAADPDSNGLDPPARSAIAAPLQNDGRIVGTLTAYDRIAGDRLTVGNFDDDDLRFIARFVATFEQAVSNAAAREDAARARALDAETGLPDAASAAETIHAEIVRAAGRNDCLALAVCSVENFASFETIADGTRTPRLARRVAGAMRAHLREFDVVARTAASEFTVILPEPGADAVDRIVALTRAVADEIAKDEALNDPLRVELGFGYALYPDDGRDRETLLAHARTIRIRML